LRLRSELTQEQLAETANISVDFLSLIERGINAPSFESLERVAKALHLEVKDLFDFD
jgi:transcriptional regulator with XRE-family HTH domain